jgi:hypothetical protein
VITEFPQSGAPQTFAGPGARIKIEAWCQWLMYVIPGTQEAEIRRIKVLSQPKRIVHETLSQKTLHKKGLVEWLKG